MWGKGLPVCTGLGKEETEVARDSPEIVNFCLLPLDLYLGYLKHGEMRWELAIQSEVAAAAACESLMLH